MVKPNIMDDAANLNFLAAPTLLAVSSGDSTAVVTFGTAMPDTNYAVFGMPDWSSILYVSAKSTAGFTITYGTSPTGTGHKLAYFVVGT